MTTDEKKSANEHKIEIIHPTRDELYHRCRPVQKRELRLFHMQYDGRCWRYGSKLIEALREVYWGGMPGSVLLLSRQTSGRYGIDMPLLMVRGLLMMGVHFRSISLVRASTTSTRILRRYWPEVAEQVGRWNYLVERQMPNGEVLVYDTSLGLAFNSRVYRWLERPRHKTVIRGEKLVHFILDLQPQKGDCDPAQAVNYREMAEGVLAEIAAGYKELDEWYTSLGLLQREVQLYRERVGLEEQSAEISAGL